MEYSQQEKISSIKRILLRMIFMQLPLKKSYKSNIDLLLDWIKSRAGSAFNRRGRIYQFIRGIMLEGVMNNVFMAFSYIKMSFIQEILAVIRKSLS